MLKKTVNIILLLILTIVFIGCDDTCRDIRYATEDNVDLLVQNQSIDAIANLKNDIDKLTEEQKNTKMDCWVNSFGGGIQRNQLNGLSIMELYDKYSLLALQDKGYKDLSSYQLELAKSKGFNTYKEYTNAKVEKLALAKSKGFNTYEEYKKAEAKKADLALAKSKGYESFEEYVRAEAKKSKIAKEKRRLAEDQERLIAKRASRTKIVSRDELNRVLTRASKYIGQIIKFKDKVDWDYVTEFQMLNDGTKNYKFYQIMTIKMKGANWSRIDQPLLFMPKDIFNAIDSDFYNKTSKNFTDYYMQSNEMELITISGSDFTKMFGSKATGKWIYPNDTVILITNIKIYNRNLGTYQTKMFNY